MMDKSGLMTRVLDEVEARLAKLRAAARDAHAAATDSGSRAESKYDTRSLEASYLAAGQAQQLEELEQTYQVLKQFSPKRFEISDAVALGAVVEVTSDEGENAWYFLVPSAGGLTVADDQRELTLVSVRSPLFGELNGKLMGEALGGGRWITEVE